MAEVVDDGPDMRINQIADHGKIGHEKKNEKIYQIEIQIKVDSYWHHQQG